jgi:hypothetical protein
MGLSKSKNQQLKPNQPGFPSQPGFSSQQSQFPASSPFGASQNSNGFGASAGGFGAGAGAFGAQVPSAFPSSAFPSQAPNSFAPPPNAFSQPQGFSSTPGFPSGSLGFPPFPAPPQQQPVNNFGASNFFSQNPVPQSSGYPVSYANQPFRPLIPGYAPAPGNDRRPNPAPEHNDQNDFSSRYFGEQQMSHLVQMPQMQQMHSVKHRKN